MAAGAETSIKSKGAEKFAPLLYFVENNRNIMAFN
jgi:hypothetical protein